jgi:hypothetical protein
MEKVTGYFNGDNYVQHDPQIRFGRSHRGLTEGDKIVQISANCVGGLAEFLERLILAINPKGGISE